MTPGKTTIRRATSADAPLLALVGAASFLETYAALIPGGDLAAHCRVKHSESEYERFLGDPNFALWLVVSDTGAPVGYLVMGPATLPEERPRPQDLEILRIYALTRFHGQGLGHQLMEAAVAEAAARGADRLVLGMYQGNTQALMFYQRQGFKIIGERRFQVGESVFDDHVLARSVHSPRS